MTRRFCLAIIFAIFARSMMAQSIPSELWGTWAVRRDLPARTISCWNEAQARAIFGTKIVYRDDSFQWKDRITKHPTVDVSVITANQFQEDNSGHGSNSSQVNFDQLGIKTPTVRQITIDHPGVRSDLPEEPDEIPGDVVLLKDRDTIIFSVCNVYFEAKRVGP
jgi:hypothetical protein